MIKLFFLIISLFFLFGCSNNDATTSQENTTSTQYLSISKAPINTEPISIVQNIALEFSKELNQNTLNSSSVYLVENTLDGNVTVETDLEVSTNKVTLSPLRYLNVLSNYTLVVTTDVQDVEGRALTQDYHFRFTTSNEFYDPSSLGFRNLKPQDHSVSALVQTDIVIDFNKTITLPKELLNTPNAILEVTDANATEINGTVEIFNSLLKFIPSEPLPYDSNITVRLNANISDMYDHPYEGVTTWWFQTKAQNVSPSINVGFVPLASADINKTSILIQGIYDTNTSSKIAVATTSSIEVFLVNYPEILTKPTLEYLHSYNLANITAMLRIDTSHLLVATADSGIYSLKVDPTNISEISHIDATDPIYSINFGYDNNNTLNKVYAVGPKYGLQVFDYNLSSGVLAFNKSVDTNNSTYLDVIEVKVYDSTIGGEVPKVYLADYNGGVDIFDENLSKTTRVDINGSVKKLALYEDYNGPMGLFAISSSGKVQAFGFDGVLFEYVKLDLPGTPSSIKSFVNFETLSSQLYYSSLDKGLLIANGDYASDIINTDGSVIASEVVNGFSPPKAFLLTLNQDGSLKLYNATKDTQNPTVSTIPPDNGTIQAMGANFTLEFYDDYLDTSTITKDKIKFTSVTGQPVDFNLSITPGEFSPVFELIPTSTLSYGNYNITIDSNISDMLGNKLNNGENNVTVNFIVTQ